MRIISDKIDTTYTLETWLAYFLNGFENTFHVILFPGLISLKVVFLTLVIHF